MATVPLTPAELDILERRANVNINCNLGTVQVNPQHLLLLIQIARQQLNQQNTKNILDTLEV